MQVNKILIPNKPHLDPIAAIYILWQYGQEKFPGIFNAKITYWENSNDPSEAEIRKLEDEGVIMIDLGGGIFDHHNKNNGQSETCASLVAAYLEVDQNPELSALLSYVREDDLEGLHNRFGDFAYMLKAMYKQNIASNQVVEFALQVLHSLQTGQNIWHHNVKNEYNEKVKIFKVKRNKNKIKVGVIESDDVQVGNFGITADNLSAVIQKRSTGHIMILTNKHHRIDLREIVAAIRKRELELRGYDKKIDVSRLKFEGRNSMLPQWFYHRSLNAFLNGSDALTKTEPTKVPFNEIVRFVLYGLTMEESELCDCAVGGQNCPYAAYGFSKCEEKAKNK